MKHQLILILTLTILSVVSAGETLFPSGQHSAQWADLPGFELTDEARRLWNSSPGQPDWRRAERSARYAGIALSKVQRWLREQCLSVRDERSGLFRSTGRQWNYRDTAADCYPFYVWAAYYTDKEILDTRDSTGITVLAITSPTQLRADSISFTGSP